MSSLSTANSRLALAPLGAGDLIDRTIRIYRQNFWTLIQIAAPPVVLSAIGAVLFMVGWREMFITDKALSFGMYFTFLMVGGFLRVVGFLAILMVMGGAARNLVRHLLFGEPISVRETYRNLRGRFWGLLFSTIIIQHYFIHCIFGNSVFVGDGLGNFEYCGGFGGGNFAVFVGDHFYCLFYSGDIGLCLVVLFGCRIFCVYSASDAGRRAKRRESLRAQCFAGSQRQREKTRLARNFLFVFNLFGVDGFAFSGLSVRLFQRHRTFPLGCRCDTDLVFGDFASVRTNEFDFVESGYSGRAFVALCG